MILQITNHAADSLPAMRTDFFIFCNREQSEIARKEDCVTDGMDRRKSTMPLDKSE